MEEPPGDDVAAVLATLLLPGPTTFEAAEAEYAEALGPLAMGEFDASAPGAYNSHFASMSRAAEGDNQQKMRRLGKELRDLRGKQRLPVGAAAAHFVRQDLERPDKVGAGGKWAQTEFERGKGVWAIVQCNLVSGRDSGVYGSCCEGTVLPTR
jgi:hypothetical protein